MRLFKNNIYIAITQSIWVAIFLVMTLNLGYSGNIAGEKVRDIKKLLKVSGILEQLTYMESDLLKVLSMQISSAYPEVPDGFWDEFNKNIIGEQEEKSLIQKIIPVYDQNIDHQTIKNLIQMFDNPFWEEWKKKMPVISREAGKMGGEWIREMAASKTIQERMDFLAEKYDLENLNKKKSRGK